jgi:thioesterase domain-containing protein/acyl carrier protein
MPTLTLESPTVRAAHSAADIRSWIVGELARSMNMNVSSIDPCAPLQSLGVDSLAAIGMSGGLAAFLGRDVPATLMWDYDSIDAIAHALAAEDEDEPELAPATPPGVVKLRAQSTRPPIFCFPGLSGQGDMFALVAAHLAADQPCFGLDVPEVSDDGQPLTTVEQMATIMQHRLRLVQPQGPYHLVGYSLGGFLAYEAAQQLTAAGESVATLAILDTFTPSGRVFRPRWQRLALHAWFLLTRDNRRLRLRDVTKRRAKRARPDNSPSGDRQNTGEVSSLDRRRQAAASYQPRPYCGGLTLLRATQRPRYNVFFKMDSTNGWGPLCRGDVHLIDVPGNHMNLIDASHAPTTAEAIMRGI